jgi:hypothetical protein
VLLVLGFKTPIAFFEKIDQKSVDDFISYWEKKLLSNG